jgi:hypothetical protein
MNGAARPTPLFEAQEDVAYALADVWNAANFDRQPSGRE